MEHLKYTEILKQNNLLKGTLKSAPYSIRLLSNVTINGIKDILEYNCRIHQIEPAISIGNFDNIVQDSATASEDMVIIFYDLMAIIDSLGIYFEDISDERYEGLLSKLKSEIDLIQRNLEKRPSVIFNLFSSGCLPPLYYRATKADKLARELNAYIEACSRTNTFLLDIDKILIQLGISNAIDFRFYHSSKAPYTIAFFKQYTLAIQPLLLQNNGKLKKALIFDCDNTLWKGIVGEDGPGGVDYAPDSASGKWFHAVHQQAVHLSLKGVLIGLCSKNNEADVEEVLTDGRMILGNDHIVIKKVNWKDKVSNLREIASELNIGLDSLVFIDDSDFEINLIREQLPEVLTMQVPKQISEYPTQLQALTALYFNAGQSKEDAQKTEMYKQQAARTQAQDSFKTIEEYLASMEINLTIAENDFSQVPRIAQLTQKTNQFNLTTRRYTEQQITGLMHNGAIFSLSVKDKFGDSGLTGICIIRYEKDSPDTAVFDSLLMSCRIIGRNIEYVFVNKIMEKLLYCNISHVKAAYIATAKNGQVAGFYEQLGFRELKSQDGYKEYELTLQNFSPKVFNYICVEQKEKQEL